MRKTAYVLAFVLIVAGLAACTDEDRNFTMHEPGVYKGQVDPLVAEKQHQELADRFKMVQTDR